MATVSQRITQLIQAYPALKATLDAAKAAYDPALERLNFLGADAAKPASSYLTNGEQTKYEKGKLYKAYVPVYDAILKTYLDAKAAVDANRTEYEDLKAGVSNGSINANDVAPLPRLASSNINMYLIIGVIVVLVIIVVVFRKKLKL